MYRLFCPKEIFLTFMCTFTYQKTLLHTFLLLVFKIIEAFSVSLSKELFLKSVDIGKDFSSWNVNLKTGMQIFSFL